MNSFGQIIQTASATTLIFNGSLTLSVNKFGVVGGGLAYGVEWKVSGGLLPIHIRS